jgi:hypothetical protein
METTLAPWTPDVLCEDQTIGFLLLAMSANDLLEAAVQPDWPVPLMILLGWLLSLFVIASATEPYLRTRSWRLVVPGFPDMLDRFLHPITTTTFS